MTRQLGLADVNQLSMYSPLVSSRRALPGQPPSVYWAALGSRSSGGGATGGGGGVAPGGVDASTTGKRGVSLDEWPQWPHAGGAGGEASSTAFKRTKAKVNKGLLGLPPPTTTGNSPRSPGATVDRS